MDAQGRRVGAQARARIRRLAIPPAWTDVRIAPTPRARLQAIGLDGAGRLQYLYHAAFTSQRSREKFGRVERFGQALPRIRATVSALLMGDTPDRDRVLAGVLRLLECAHFRVGSEAGARSHRTYGVTTLDGRHLKIEPDGSVRFVFRGKHRVLVRRRVADAGLTRLLAQLRAAHAPRLFSYEDAAGRWRRVTARDVNAFLQAVAGAEFHAKDYRTWAGTLAAARALDAAGPSDRPRERARRVTAAMQAAAAELGNTPAVARRAYVHPYVVDWYREGRTLREAGEPDVVAEGLEPDERALLALFRRTRLGEVDALLEWVLGRFSRADWRSLPPDEAPEASLVSPT